MNSIVTVKHNFETAHRLPFLGGKCENLHGHSWQVEWRFEQPMDENGITVEYGELKASLRGWVDKYLDHGAMLGEADPLVSVLESEGSKLLIFGKDWEDYPWPTVEATAAMLADIASVLTGIQPCEVIVQETAVNSAIWRKA